MELRQMECFVTVAEELHFGRAARRLHVVQPAVSQQIRQLEHALGVRLFERSTRTVALTAAGQAVLPTARAILGSVQEARIVAARYTRPDGSLLRIGTSPAVHGRLLLSVDRLQTSHPDLAVELVTVPENARVDMVRSGDLDATVGSGEGGGQDEGDVRAAGLRRQRLRWDPLLAGIPVSHALAGHEQILPTALRRLPMRDVRSPLAVVVRRLVEAVCRLAELPLVPSLPVPSVRQALTGVADDQDSWVPIGTSSVTRADFPRIHFARLELRGMATRTDVLTSRTPTGPVLAWLAACGADGPAGGGSG